MKYLGSKVQRTYLRSLRSIELLSDLNFFQTNADLCGQDRVTLAEWFWNHGSPSLLLDPIPEVR